MDCLRKLRNVSDRCHLQHRLAVIEGWAIGCLPTGAIIMRESKAAARGARLTSTRVTPPIERVEEA